MMPAALVYALLDEEQRAALTRLPAARRAPYDRGRVPRTRRRMFRRAARSERVS